MDAKLIVVGGKANKDTVQLNLPSVVGRSREADLTIAHPMISRRHCELFESDGVLMIRDLGSLNGTYVGHRRITEAPLKPDEEFTIGPLTFRAIYEYSGDASRFDDWQEGEMAAPASPAPRQQVSGEAPTPQQAMSGLEAPVDGTLHFEEASQPAPPPQEAPPADFLSWLSDKEQGEGAGVRGGTKVQDGPWGDSDASQTPSGEDPLADTPTDESPEKEPEIEAAPTPSPGAGASDSAEAEPEQATNIGKSAQPGAEPPPTEGDVPDPVGPVPEIAISRSDPDAPVYDLDLDLDLNNEIEEEERRPVFGPGNVEPRPERKAFPDAGSVDDADSSDSDGGSPEADPDGAGQRRQSDPSSASSDRS